MNDERDNKGKGSETSKESNSGAPYSWGNLIYTSCQLDKKMKTQEKNPATSRLIIIFYYTFNL